MLPSDEIRNLIANIPEGYSEVIYQKKKYSITRKNFNLGKSVKVYAEELGGNDFISFNYYETSDAHLKPCEMPQEKVIHFLKNI